MQVLLIMTLDYRLSAFLHLHEYIIRSMVSLTGGRKMSSLIDMHVHIIILFSHLAIWMDWQYWKKLNIQIPTRRAGRRVFLLNFADKLGLLLGMKQSGNDFIK